MNGSAQQAQQSVTLPAGFIINLALPFGLVLQLRELLDKEPLGKVRELDRAIELQTQNAVQQYLARQAGSLQGAGAPVEVAPQTPQA